MARPPRFATLPPGALRAFESAARLGSFKAAGMELAVTAAAVSQQVKALEHRLGLALFDRLHRALRLTESGAQLAATLHPAVAAIDDRLAALAADGAVAGGRTLTVSAVPSFAAKWLAPRLHRFARRHPGIELRLAASEVLLDLTRERTVDVAIRYGTGPYGAGLSAERLWAAVPIVAVCTPALIRRGGLEQPAGLLRQTLIRTAPIPGRPDTTARHGGIGWLDYLAALGLSGPDAARAARQGPLVGTTQLALEAAVGGHGVALAPCVLVADDLAAGRLAQPYGLALDNDYAFWVLHRAGREPAAPVQAFAEWLRAEAAAGDGPGAD